MPPIINSDICTGCGICFDRCSMDVFYGSERGKPPVVSYPDECWHCNACVLDCPVKGAVELRIPLPMMMVYKSS